MAPEGWRRTVEKVAINAVMAGATPREMPVLLAAVQAFGSGHFASGVRSTNSFSFMQLVNGPIAREVGMNSGTYALGPGNRANATIGRALRLFIYNLGGGENGINLMGTQGNVGSYAFCFAENEALSPWEPFQVSPASSLTKARSPSSPADGATPATCCIRICAGSRATSPISSGRAVSLRYWRRPRRMRRPGAA